ncbi:2-hydroxymuconic semialdehyde dehydrogenase [Schaalia cardiffensis]|uniref:putative acetyltransferase n=1 Tax=Schaalia cardiffensis TaxID=181487 RepID=UPI001E652330|nr:2-hydroxymuconic semialdehyde dehydrogenase [Schaalia cardiffensis]
MKHEEHTHSTDRLAIREDVPVCPNLAPAPKASIPEDAYNANQTPPPLPWLKWSPGERVVVRYRLSDGLHDALGTLLETAFDYVVIETRRGPVRVEAATMVTGKKVPPPPSFIS